MGRSRLRGCLETPAGVFPSAATGRPYPSKSSARGRRTAPLPSSSISKLAMSIAVERRTTIPATKPCNATGGAARASNGWLRAISRIQAGGHVPRVAAPSAPAAQHSSAPRPEPGARKRAAPAIIYPPHQYDIGSMTKHSPADQRHADHHDVERVMRQMGRELHRLRQGDRQQRRTVTQAHHQADQREHQNGDAEQFVDRNERQIISA